MQDYTFDIRDLILIKFNENSGHKTCRFLYSTVQEILGRSPLPTFSGTFSHILKVLLEGFEPVTGMILSHVPLPLGYKSVNNIAGSYLISVSTLAGAAFRVKRSFTWQYYRAA